MTRPPVRAIAAIAPGTQPELEARFWAKVDRSGGSDACWPWLGHTDPENPYGNFTVGYETFRAHRFALAISGTDVPADKHALHKCDNPPCCNPSHLFLGTPKDNGEDMARKGRSLSGDKNYVRQNPWTVRGENNASAVLSESDVRSIVVLAGTGVLFGCDIAKAFGVTDHHVSLLCNPNSSAWPHLEGLRRTGLPGAGLSDVTADALLDHHARTGETVQQMSERFGFSTGQIGAALRKLCGSPWRRSAAYAAAVAGAEG